MHTCRWHARSSSPDGTVYAVPGFYGYEIRAFEPTGKRKEVICRAYQTLRREPQERRRIEEFYGVSVHQAAGVGIRIEDSHRDIEKIQAGPDGHLWVLLSRGMWRAPDGALGVYDIFETDGRFIQQVTLWGEGDPWMDDVWVLGRRVVVVRNRKACVWGSTVTSS